jgi:AcrR family transcriptional regulator
MVKKAPRRTAERILEAALALFNRFGEPNVSTTLISAELRISPGNLYYHYAAKDELVNALFERFERELNLLLDAGPGVRDLEDAWFFIHSMFELVWQYRFLYRDLNHLLGKNRLLETHFQTILRDKAHALHGLLAGLARSGTLRVDADEMEGAATRMVLLLTYWLSYEYVRNPRHALEEANAEKALLSGARHALGSLAPYLDPGQRAHMKALIGAYAQAPAQALDPVPAGLTGPRAASG